MSGTPAVSVPMPADNVTAFVRAAVQSLLAQDVADFEPIVVADGSTDEPPERFAGFRRSARSGADPSDDRRYVLKRAIGSPGTTWRRSGWRPAKASCGRYDAACFEEGRPTAREKTALVRTPDLLDIFFQRHRGSYGRRARDSHLGADFARPAADAQAGRGSSLPSGAGTWGERTVTALAALAHRSVRHLSRWRPSTPVSQATARNA